MADNKYSMDLKKYRNKYMIICHQNDVQLTSAYIKYQIIDVMNPPLEKTLVFVLKDPNNKLRKVICNCEILQTGQSIFKMEKHTYYGRIVNARNFPIIDSSYINLE